MDVIDLIGRVLFALVFWQNGYRQLAQRQNMVAYAQSFGAPAPAISVPVTGVVMLLGATMLVLGIWPDIAAIALFLFLVAAAFIAHRYWEHEDFGMRAGQEAQFMKNIAMAGACLVFLAVYSQFDEDLIMLVGTVL
jgi:uncharacterized membrane protein YphA (DoxX/SURF4 family)